MPCKTIPLGDGYAIVCSRSRGRSSRLCGCGRIAPLVCDWPTPGRASGTCDKPVCNSCRRVIRGKDACPFHRGDMPMTPEEQAAAGASEAANAAAILGLED
jgi:hypothetical protein